MEIYRIPFATQAGFGLGYAYIPIIYVRRWGYLAKYALT